MDDREIIAEFVTESREHLADIENQLLAIEAAGADADSELVNTVFRAVHSIKGAAGFLGFSAVGQLAHDLENVLNLVRNGQLVPNAGITDVLLRSADRLRALIDDIDHSNGMDIAEYVEALQRIVAGLLAEEVPNPPACSLLGGEHHAAGQAMETPGVSPDPCGGINPGSSENTSPGDTAPQRGFAGMNQSGPAYTPAERETHRSPEGARTPASPAPAGGTAGESSIRVNVSVLDRLMNLAGELVLARNQLMQASTSADPSAWSSISARINQVTSELQESIMQTRLQPIGTIFGRFPRVVRDLSNSLGKQCELSIEGSEVELDKSIIEGIGDPLTHLIRNSVDHGVETPHLRIGAGKPAIGRIVLRAFHQAGKVNIQITDDGRGIDAARLKEKAVARGLLTPEQSLAMSDREALLLIFRPGFSLAEKVTDVSGRGVGMDVVKTNIERLGGTVTVDTQPGVGTTIHVKLPLTLAIISSLVVRCSDRRYAIPQASIRELVRIKGADATKRIERVQGAEVFRLRGTLLPLVRLSATLGLETAEDRMSCSETTNIIVVEAGHLRYGLIVDALCDSEEIVVKPLGRHMKGIPCLAGATILGDGRVALILDTSGIATQAKLTVPEEDTTRELAVQSDREETQSLLLFSYHPGEHFGIPMDLVARLERVQTDSIDTVGGVQILQHRGGTLPLLSLEEGINCQPRSEAAKVYVVVFSAAGREMGLLVPELIDIRSVPMRIDSTTFREPGISGSLVYEQMTVRLVDLHELVRKLHPDWYQCQPLPTTEEGGTARILVAEDSDFFRKQLVGFFTDEGYEVEGCEDGAAAWRTLQDPDKQFDLLVTDIEMPNMNGLELAERVRSDARLAELPVVAVTSLASEEDIHRGQQVGITEYHVKLDREQLTGTVGRLLATKSPRSHARSGS